jgi:hypothetical protein
MEFFLFFWSDKKNNFLDEKQKTIFSVYYGSKVLLKKKTVEKKAKEIKTLMKVDKEVLVLVDFYEEIIQEILQPNTQLRFQNI